VSSIDFDFFYVAWMAEPQYDPIVARSATPRSFPTVSHIDAATGEIEIVLAAIVLIAAKNCTPEEFKQFQSLNKQYKEKFGFPFVMAVRHSNRSDILRAFARRLQNDKETEFATAIAEIHKIARLRLEAMDKP